MKTEKWLAEVYRRAAQDPWHAECLADVQSLAPAYEAIRAALPEAQQTQLEDYIAACEELAHSLLLPAYEAGRAQGTVTVINSIDPLREGR